MPEMQKGAVLSRAFFAACLNFWDCSREQTEGTAFIAVE